MHSMTDEQQRIKMLVSVPGNNQCCDCKVPAPVWTSINLGILVCVKCSGVHRKMGTHISQVKSLQLDVDCWKGDLLKFMCNNGNAKVNAIYEVQVPPGYLRPQDYDSRDDVRENWIRAKWERREFTAEFKGKDESRYKEGFLIKCSEKDNRWQRRWFVLSGVCLSYYKKHTDEAPRGIIMLHGAKIELPTDDGDHSKGGLLVQTKERTYCLQASSDREMIDWVHALRGAIHYYERPPKGMEPAKTRGALDSIEASIRSSISTILLLPSRKSGPLAIREIGMFSTKWLWRWGALYDGVLLLTKTDKDASFLSVILLENCKTDAIAVTEISKDHCFVVRSYNKQMILSSESKATVNQWITEINAAKTRPVNLGGK